MLKPLVVVAGVAAGVLASALPAAADATYHSAHIPLLREAGTVVGSGFVENIHANGPNVFAHELYQLQHAAPTTTYEVTLHIYVGEPTCRSTSVDLPSTTLTTNVAGNGFAQKFFTPADAAGLPKGESHGIVWTVSAGAGATYTTGCETVVLD